MLFLNSALILLRYYQLNLEIETLSIGYVQDLIESNIIFLLILRFSFKTKVYYIYFSINMP